MSSHTTYKKRGNTQPLNRQQSSMPDLGMVHPADNPGLEGLDDKGAGPPGPLADRTAYLTTTEAASYLRMSKQFLEIARHRGNGPPYIKLAQAVRYEQEMQLRRMNAAWLEFWNDFDEDYEHEEWPLDYVTPSQYRKMNFTDQQAMIFYQWEDICIRQAREWPKLNLDECLELMREVFAHYKSKSCPDLRTLKPGNYHDAGGYWDAQQGVIGITPGYQKAPLILHECAHALTYYSNHGPAFKKKFLILLKRHLNFVPQCPKEWSWLERVHDELEKQKREEARQKWRQAELEVAPPEY